MKMQNNDICFFSIFAFFEIALKVECTLCLVWCNPNLIVFAKNEELTNYFVNLSIVCCSETDDQQKYFFGYSVVGTLQPLSFATEWSRRMCLNDLSKSKKVQSSRIHKILWFTALFVHHKQWVEAELQLPMFAHAKAPAGNCERVQLVWL